MPNSMAVDNSACPDVRAPQQLCCRADITRFQSMAHNRTADMLAWKFLSQHHIYTKLLSVRFVILKRFTLRTPKMMIIAYDEYGNAQLLLQHLLHKLPRSESGHSAVKRKNKDVIDSRSAQERHLFIHTGQQQWCTLWCKHGARMAVESN